jgi:hypothetical protein
VSWPSVEPRLISYTSLDSIHSVRPGETIWGDDTSESSKLATILSTVGLVPRGLILFTANLISSFRCSGSTLSPIGVARDNVNNWVDKDLQVLQVDIKTFFKSIMLPPGFHERFDRKEDFEDKDIGFLSI